MCFIASSIFGKRENIVWNKRSEHGVSNSTPITIIIRLNILKFNDIVKF